MTSSRGRGLGKDDGGGVQKHQISDDVILICDCERSPIVNAMPYAAICHITTVLVVVVHQHVVSVCG